jgi:RNAse (barnase) inhibitor barstar
MKYIQSSFYSGDEKSFSSSDGFKRIIVINERINNKDHLFDVLSRNLNFPSYFGGNWDAVADLLCDFSWYDEEIIFIVFKLDIDQEILYILKDIAESACEIRNNAFFERGIYGAGVQFIFL